MLLARRPGHPMGPLLCLIGLADAIQRSALRVRAVRPDSLARFAAVLDRDAMGEHVGLRAGYQPGRSGPAAGLPRREAAVAAVAARTVGGAGFHPAFRGRLRLHPAELGLPLPQPVEPIRHSPVRQVVRGIASPGHSVRADRRCGGGGERDAALAPGGPGGTPAAQVAPGRAAGGYCLPHRDPGRPRHR